MHAGAGRTHLNALPPLALYVHLPWCLRKCPYCDFNSHEAQPGEEQQGRYLAGLLADLELALPAIWGRPVVSVFIGGGTPSLFSPERIDELMAGLRARLPLQPGCEVTLEANPGTFERERFRAYRAAGVTRLSVGVQSFDDAALQAIGRVHDGDQARAALDEAAQCFDTFNIDLMYALPGQDLGALRADLQAALAFEPPHLSIYHLTIEANTRFAKYPPTGLPDEDAAWQMLDEIAERTGAAQLARYEVSAFARTGHHCRHNLNYWEFGDYLGIGAGAHSKLSQPDRIWREVRWRDPARYVELALARNAVAQSHELPRPDLAFEYMLNALRLRQGFRIADFQERTGLSFTAIQAPIDVAIQKGWIERDLQRMWPTDRGFDFLSDLQSLFLPEDPSPPGGTALPLPT